MATTYRFITSPSDPSPVLNWFRSLPTPPEEITVDEGVMLYFRECGAIVQEENGRIDITRSPVVSLIDPQVRIGALWSVGEVHFLPKQLRANFPGLHSVNTAFSKWIKRLRLIYSKQLKESEFEYYLEGTVKNYDAPIYAFSSGLSAIKSGRYFVGHMDNTVVLNVLKKKLQLRGVELG